MCQPEASFDLLSAPQHKDPNSDNTALLNKQLKWQKEKTARGLRYVLLYLTSMKFFVFVDASFAKNKNLTSQIGYTIVLGSEEEDLTDSFKMTVNIIHWSSMKCKRVTRSVLASEIYAMAHSVNMAAAIAGSIKPLLTSSAPSTSMIFHKFQSLSMQMAGLYTSALSSSVSPKKNN